jgi:hypothetical protein
LITNDSPPDVHERGTRRLPHLVGLARNRPGRPPASGPSVTARGPLPDHPAPVPNLGGAGTELSVEMRVEDLARAYPDAVEAGFELLAEWRAESAEHRRKSLRRREHDKRRRRRGELGDG